jgi:phosphopantothenate-cysteine ligase/phosphopantothenoylcysteine decarboxylase/phosphopantothenate--cysteine ligase
MHLLITAGNTQAPIDRVRCITNIFSGRTGAAIAVRAWERGHTVTLATSHPEVVAHTPDDRWTLLRYRTFDELRELMAEQIQPLRPDGVIHCAAVSDFLIGGVYPSLPSSPLPDTSRPLIAGKIKSDTPELWLRLVRAPKLIDLVRGDWGFRGVLVKFKLEVGVSEERLLEVAERSRQQSHANLMVANTLDGMRDWAFLGPLAGRFERVARGDLADRLLDAIEALHKER